MRLVSGLVGKIAQKKNWVEIKQSGGGEVLYCGYVRLELLSVLLLRKDSSEEIGWK